MSWWVSILGRVGDHPRQFLLGVSFVDKVLVPNYISVVYFLLVVDHPWVDGYHPCVGGGPS